MKRYLLGLLLMVLIVSGCGRFDLFTTPRINITARVSRLTQEEFESVGTAGIDNPSINDFRKLEFQVKISNSSHVTDKELEVPTVQDFQAALDKDTHRAWSGGSSYRNADGEKVSLAEYHAFIYARGLSEEELRVMLIPLQISIGWRNKDGSRFSQDYYLGQVLEFKE
ncbi:hypothetical protein MFMK1_003611 [Metallumcola ferriviriculae]|uniref:Lipoprotein n=1 Tax=Metallumcola ferriviriculae TaxID=3039180 RepID=A0AAU0URK5_9FIRM|nr:hypothetical protein MFMK1_003611 [Desulfitibacteraceae bacterium MK1]